MPIRNGAVTSAVLVHLRVEPAHFDWRWRERPALALLAWEALVRDPLGRLRRIQVESIGTAINFGPADSVRPDALLHLTFARSRRCSGESTINRIVQIGRNRQHAIERFFRPFPPWIERVLVHYKKTRAPDPSPDVLGSSLTSTQCGDLPLR